MSILEPSKIVMYGFWCDYVKPNMKKMQNFVAWIQAAF